MRIVRVTLDDRHSGGRRPSFISRSPAGTPHRFANTGEVDVRFIVVSTPSTRDDRRPAPAGS
jgi:uncharacterized cupin superfamily protein